MLCLSASPAIDSIWLVWFGFILLDLSCDVRSYAQSGWCGRQSTRRVPLSLRPLFIFARRHISIMIPKCTSYFEARELLLAEARSYLRRLRTVVLCFKKFLTL
jgi:hypothetical protein